ncbi:hypothetical protein Ahy_A06g030202 [Arachis hypogaea]|uniref:Uncharacterized protein n=1 Tax=Arachis hypogaea TaxID=3818 RepID=A0A445CVJ1_ARAHY|nr:hypothetical protein Ahy_A06g030202 [Arachis hypogaea]
MEMITTRTVLDVLGVSSERISLSKTITLNHRTERYVWRSKRQLRRYTGDREESYNKVPRLLQALQGCCPRTIYDFRTVPYYDGHLVVRDCSQFYKRLSSIASPLSSSMSCIYMAHGGKFHVMSHFKSVQGKRYLVNAAYSQSKAGYAWYMDALRGLSCEMAD